VKKREHLGLAGDTAEKGLVEGRPAPHLSFREAKVGCGSFGMVGGIQPNTVDALLRHPRPIRGSNPSIGLILPATARITVPELRYAVLGAHLHHLRPGVLLAQNAHDLVQGCPRFPRYPRL
jgi:hypothetical protein